MKLTQQIAILALAAVMIFALAGCAFQPTEHTQLATSEASSSQQGSMQASSSNEIVKTTVLLRDIPDAESGG